MKSNSPNSPAAGAKKHPAALRTNKTGHEFPFGEPEQGNVVPLLRRGSRPTAAHEDGVLRATDFTMKAARHLWYPYLPLGKITIFDGDPGRGKSQITVDLAGRITTGEPMPDAGIVVNRNRPAPLPRGVVMICAEDDWGDTILPRLLATVKELKPTWGEVKDRDALNRVAVVGMKKDDHGNVIPLEFPRDVSRVKAAITAVDAVLVVVDPIMAFFGEDTNTGSDASVRKALGPFKELAAETGAAFVLIRHLNKSVDQKAEYRGGGSHGGFVGLARSAWMVGKHPEDVGRFVFVHAKANITVGGRSMTYVIVSRTVQDVDGEDIETSGVEWGEGIDMDADTLMGGHDSRNDAPARDECWEHMSALLAEQDPRPARPMKKLLLEAGHSVDTINRTKRYYGVRSVAGREHGPISGWMWTRQPDTDTPEDTDDDDKGRQS